MNRRPSRSHAVTTFNVQMPLTWSLFTRTQSHDWTGGHHFQCSSAADVIILSEKAIIWMNKRPSRSHAVTTFNVQVPLTWSLFLRKQSHGWTGGPVACLRCSLSMFTRVKSYYTSVSNCAESLSISMFNRTFQSYCTYRSSGGLAVGKSRWFAQSWTLLTWQVRE
jgi:hypothetical protein